MSDLIGPNAKHKTVLVNWAWLEEVRRVARQIEDLLAEFSALSEFPIEKNQLSDNGKSE
jgi:hypothetical protein